MQSAADYRQAQKRQYIDEYPMPEWGPGPDGRHVKIGGDIRLQTLYKQWQEDACAHPRTVIVCWSDSLSRPRYTWFCEDCGCELSSAIKRELAEAHGISGYHKDAMASRSNAYVASRQAAREKLIADAAERMQPVNRGEYDDYLRSPDWQRRVSKIMQRANHVCEGCLTNRAEVVHHLTYAHIGEEFAFELVALCNTCHARVHHAEAAE